MHIAAACGHNEIVRALIAKGAHTNVWDKSGTMPLHAAVQECDTQAVQLLLDGGKDMDAVNVRDGGGKALIYYAVEAERSDVVALLIKNGAEIEPKGYVRTPLQHAVIYGDVDTVRLLINSGADITVEEQGDSLVRLAAKRNRADVVTLLKQRGLYRALQGIMRTSVGMERGAKEQAMTEDLQRIQGEILVNIEKADAEYKALGFSHFLNSVARELGTARCRIIAVSKDVHPWQGGWGEAFSNIRDALRLLTDTDKQEWEPTIGPVVCPLYRAMVLLEGVEREWLSSRPS